MVPVKRYILSYSLHPAAKPLKFLHPLLGRQQNRPKKSEGHIADFVVEYNTIRESLVSLFVQFEFDSAYRATLQNLRQANAKSIAANAAAISNRIRTRAAVNSRVPVTILEKRSDLSACK